MTAGETAAEAVPQSRMALVLSLTEDADYPLSAQTYADLAAMRADIEQWLDEAMILPLAAINWVQYHRLIAAQNVVVQALAEKRRAGVGRPSGRKRKAEDGAATAPAPALDDDARSGDVPDPGLLPEPS